MKLIKTCIFPLLLVLILLFISHHISATETSKDGKKANDQEPKQSNIWRRGRVCRYGCCGHWRGNYCSYCCRPDGSAEVTNDDDDDDEYYGWGGRGGFGFGWGGHGGGWGGSWGGSWGGGGGGWGGCRYGCCGHRDGYCNKCCDSAAEAKAYHQNEVHP